MKAKILFFDVETSPSLGYVWQKWETNVIEFKQEWDILSFAFKWQGDRAVHVQSQRAQSETSVLKKLWKVLDAADVVVAHNGKSFDVKKTNARFISVGMPPPSPYKLVDTKIEAKKYFNFSSNSLNDLGKQFKLGKKVSHTGFEMWLGCMNGESASWDLMEKYNKQDVVLLEAVYNKLLPWMDTHPNVSHIVGRPEGCPKCGSKHLQARGKVRTKTQVYRSFQCQSCGGWCRARLAEKDVVKPKVVNL